MSQFRGFRESLSGLRRSFAVRSPVDFCLFWPDKFLCKYVIRSKGTPVLVTRLRGS